MLGSMGWLLAAAACAARGGADKDCVGSGCDTGEAPPAGCEAADEICDGLDNDCDGDVDEDAVDGATWYADADGDGLGDDQEAVTACDAPAGAVAAAGDCDDTDAAVFPGAAETCDGRDEDCDGATDAEDPDLSGQCPGDAAWPGDVLDLSVWKLTLPIGSDEDPESPMEITWPELGEYSVDPWFRLDAEGDGVLFRANAGGVTTSNSGYPRSELREMAEGGAERASWSTSSGVHTMTITQAVTALPEVKPHAVVGQIHDAEDDLVMIRLEGDHLFVEGGGENLGDLDTSYALGEVFTVRIVAAEGQIEVYYNDLSAPAVTVSRDTDGCYFKAGIYTQSNPDRGDAPDAYAEAEIQALTVRHE